MPLGSGAGRPLRSPSAPPRTSHEHRHRRSPRHHFQPRAGLRLPGHRAGTGEPRDDHRRRRRVPALPMAQEAARRVLRARRASTPFAFTCEIGGRRAHVARPGQQRDVAHGHGRRVERARGRTALARGGFRDLRRAGRAPGQRRARRSSAGSRWRAARKGTRRSGFRWTRRCSSCC